MSCGLAWRPSVLPQSPSSGGPPLIGLIIATLQVSNGSFTALSVVSAVLCLKCFQLYGQRRRKTLQQIFPPAAPLAHVMCDALKNLVLVARTRGGYTRARSSAGADTTPLAAEQAVNKLSYMHMPFL